MEDRIRKALATINPEFVNYHGNNLFEDLGIDSHDIFNVVMALEEAFEIEISPIYMRMENFTSIDKIEEMITGILQGSKEQT